MESVWNSDVNFRKRDTLRENIECDILVIGAGMAGLLTAYMLKKAEEMLLSLMQKALQAE